MNAGRRADVTASPRHHLNRRSNCRAVPCRCMRLVDKTNSRVGPRARADPRISLIYEAHTAARHGAAVRPPVKMVAGRRGHVRASAGVHFSCRTQCGRVAVVVSTSRDRESESPLGACAMATQLPATDVLAPPRCSDGQTLTKSY